ncbi:hypothetical protein [Sphingosinicella sp. BN140058]|uniref:hypothetical protein n=1 Tax=Sphingosinicella sp. BN140058 TaxID=1892855 RepID=UPI001012F7BE|nr:hypothetical protein [Sphingosinicella sp. BN140058]QAY77966.1 hypothetical protein ETR14_16620 [Sphingosinicella sp. BN140058]
MLLLILLQSAEVEASSFDLAEVHTEKRRPGAELKIVPACGSDPGSEEILVCGRRDDGRYRVQLPTGETPTRMDAIRQSMTMRIGSAELGPGTDKDRAVGFQLRIPF